MTVGTNCWPASYHQRRRTKDFGSYFCSLGREIVSLPSSIFTTLDWVNEGCDSRPKTIEDVSAQEHTIKVLRKTLESANVRVSSIAYDSCAHASNITSTASSHAYVDWTLCCISQLKGANNLQSSMDRQELVKRLLFSLWQNSSLGETTIYILLLLY